jgi:hypothetical protein
MAKDKGEAAMPAAPKAVPECHISWPGPESVDKDYKFKVDGNLAGIGLGKTIEVTIRGKVSGFRLDKYGGSIDLRTRSLSVGRVSETSEDESGEPLTDMVERMQEGKKKA